MKKKTMIRNFSAGFMIAVLGTGYFSVVAQTQAAKPLDTFEGHPPIHVHKHSASAPVGLTPSKIKAIYNLPSTGGSGTIAIIDAYDYPTAQNDLNFFSAQYGLPALPTCSNTIKTTCFEKHTMAAHVRSDNGWALEAALDTQWAHAIAPTSRILLVEAKSAGGNDLLDAVTYARNRADVVAVSMSWGSKEFSGASSYDSSFVSPSGAAFFASSGDSGTGVQWPAVSKNVIAVGGTTLNLDANNNLLSETAWDGSGGGLSVYELASSYQTTFGVPQANGKRAVPDVSYNADPASGVSVYDTTSYQGQKGWFQIGGTSAGAPQWAAIKALGTSVTASKLYQDATASYAAYFRDVTSGTNGSCGFYCTSAANYDYITGLGSPLTTSY